jgi:hypothetical protein
MKKEITLIFIFVMFSMATWAQSATCAGATPVTVDGGCLSSQNVTDVTFETGAGNSNLCGNGNSTTREAWYSFQATAASVSVAWTSGRQPAIQVFSGSCGSLTQIGCADNNIFSGTQTEVVNLTGLTIGNTYLVRIVNTAGNSINLANAGTLCINAIHTNCNTAVPVCNDNSFAGNASGFGTQELSAANRGCLSNNEHQTTWFGFSPSLTGNIQLTIAPTAGAVDYDFAIWGPYNAGTCPVTGAPIRCSYSSVTTNTGMQTGSGDVSEGSGGDGWVDPLVITAGDIGKIYYLMVDNFNSTTTPFTLDWTFSTPGMLDCTPPLPIELGAFTGTTQDKTNALTWSTQSESNNSHFIIDKSIDGINYTELGRVIGSGNSNVDKHYDLVDPKPFELTYYRLQQVDYDGTTTSYSPIVVMNNNLNEFSVTDMFPNPADQNFFIDLYSKDALSADVFVYNSVGQMVYSKVSEIDGSVRLEVPSETWVPGIYIVKVINDEHHFQHIQRMIIK